MPELQCSKPVTTQVEYIVMHVHLYLMVLMGGTKCQISEDKDLKLTLGV